MTAPTRPVLRYHGGKWRLAHWILTFFPAHRVYVEPFGGAASVLLRKPRCYAEIYNDLDDEVVNVFRVLRDPASAVRLRDLLTLTPYSRADFEAAYLYADDDVERARRSIVKAFMGFGSGSIHDPREHGMRTRASTWKPPTGYRANSDRSGTTPAYDWSHYPEQIAAFCERMQGVVIENRRATAVLSTHDKTDALHYVDPPYVRSTRSLLKRRGTTGAYKHEMTDDDHRELSTVLHGLRGMVVLSGYPCELYDRELYADWERHERKHLADGARTRTEVVWLNPACAAARSQTTLELAR